MRHFQHRVILYVNCGAGCHRLRINQRPPASAASACIRDSVACVIILGGRSRQLAYRGRVFLIAIIKLFTRMTEADTIVGRDREEATVKGGCHCNADNATWFSVPGGDNRSNLLRFDCLMNELRFVGH